MPIHDYKCDICDIIQERLEFGDEIDKPHICPKCNTVMKRMLPTKMSFKLVYNPKKDKFDWEGNRTQYYDEVNKLRKQGIDADPLNIPSRE